MERVLIGFLAVAAVVLQTTVVPKIALFGAAPDLIFLLVVFFSLQRKTTLGVWTAFFLGFLQDIAGGGPVGLSTVALLGVAYAIGLLQTKLFKENLTAQVLIVVALTWFHQFMIFYWLNTICKAGFPLGQLLQRAALMSAYHAVLGPLLFIGLAGWIRGEDVYEHLITHSKLDTQRWLGRRVT